MNSVVIAGIRIRSVEEATEREVGSIVGAAEHTVPRSAVRTLEDVLVSVARFQPAIGRRLLASAASIPPGPL